MIKKKRNPFDKCPVYETKSLTYGLVDIHDAEDLFLCYTDPVTLSHMNNDNCSGEFRCASVDVMKQAIILWRKEYERRTFLRGSVRDKNNGKAVGTIEIAPLPWGKWFFGNETPIGILRIDLLSTYEKEATFSEMIGFLSSELANDFEINQVILKALPEETAKINALFMNQFIPYTPASFPFKHYYCKTIQAVKA